MDVRWPTADARRFWVRLMSSDFAIASSVKRPLLRVAVPADVRTMAAIEVVSFSDPWPASAFADLLEQAHARVVVAIAPDHALLGYYVLLIAADEGEIGNIAVAPAARRQGVGALLLDDAIAFAESSGVLQLFLEVRTSNESARRLYASRNFVPVGRRRAYYREPLEDALVLRRGGPPAG